jgi:hypothetical protein
MMCLCVVLLSTSMLRAVAYCLEELLEWVGCWYSL